MTTMKSTELNNKSESELNIMLADMRIRLSHLRSELIEKKLKNFNDIGRLKRDIARVLTRLNHTA